jgi:hypothetical protein
MGDMSSGLQGLGKKGSYWRDGKLYSIMNDPQYGYLMPDGTPDTRWQTAPIRVGGAINEKLTDGVFGLIEGGRYLKDIDYATIPDRILGSLEKGAADLTVGAIEGGRYLKDRYNAAENWLDDKYDAVADWYNPPWEKTSNPVTSGGPLSRGNSYERYLGRMEERYRNGIPEYNTPNYGQIEGRTEAIQDRNLERDANQSFTSGWNQGSGDALTGLTAKHAEAIAELANYGAPLAGDYGPDLRGPWEEWRDSLKEGWRAR